MTTPTASNPPPTNLSDPGSTSTGHSPETLNSDSDGIASTPDTITSAKSGNNKDTGCCSCTLLSCFHSLSQSLFNHFHFLWQKIFGKIET
jgi:hypothetical protein